MFRPFTINQTVFALSVALLIASLGCVRGLATGPLFSETPAVEPSKALVLVYFPTSIRRGVTQGIVVNGKLEKRLDYGGYVAILLPPGNVTFDLLDGSWEGENAIALQTLPARISFIRVKERYALSGSTFRLEEVKDTEALPQIKQCRAMEPPNEDDCAGLKAGLIACSRTPRN